jgi:hypothetical protein
MKTYALAVAPVMFVVSVQLGKGSSAHHRMPSYSEANHSRLPQVEIE